MGDRDRASISGETPAQPQGSSPARGHAHRWRGLEFLFRNDHPWFRMTCTCGAERDIRAWERYWDPQADDGRG